MTCRIAEFTLRLRKESLGAFPPRMSALEVEKPLWWLRAGNPYFPPAKPAMAGPGVSSPATL